MTKRTIAMAKGITLLCMPAVHSALLYVTPQYWHGPVYRFLSFVAQWPGAQLFLFIQGYYIGKPRSLTTLLKRYMWLMLAAVSINFMKGSLPSIMSILPLSLYSHYDTDKQHAFFHFLAMGDFLHCAALLQLWGIAIYLLTSFRKLPVRYACLSILVTLLLNSFIHRLYTLSAGALFVGSHPNVFFPFVPWGMYGMFGYLCALMVSSTYMDYSKINDYILDHTLRCLLLLLIAVAIFPVMFNRYDNNFYLPSNFMVIVHGFFILLWLVFMQVVHRVIPSCFRIDYFWYFLSRHITLFYAIQWVVVIYSLPIWKYQRINGEIGFLASTINTMACIALLRILTICKKANPKL